ncbi:RHS repeat-associated core domain-containing protein [Pseudomonas sp. LAIL14HWK12:I11]|uniref:RHS repeat-associated core domain-containing protein n=2 Tax=Pseudomonas TaxID=286 RepID=UPI000A0BCDAA|nr:RHS repeat-associated core domain-containing protein [Pseudomonas sp. LAIL14HWK12:I11]SMR75159.1 RHS repeat-associated core domain-containing protein [Pseudomonas sp. LAIL14HWK12:I10]SOD02006.1 RHS repeat-associated core domain-containing protein [Pseudomonas sp. LAIL14HWK12:I8]
MQSHGPLSRTHKLFYQNGALSIEIGPCTTRYFASEAGVVAQCTPGASTSLYRVDQLMTVLGTTDGPHQQRFTVYGFPAPGSFKTPLGFSGQRFNAMSGCYPLGHGHRWFNPRVMRFGQSDSLSPFGKGGVNSYAYCQNDPVNRLDPNGRIWHLLQRAGNWFLQTIYPAPGASPTVRPLLDDIDGVGPTPPITKTVINKVHPNLYEALANRISGFRHMTETVDRKIIDVHATYHWGINVIAKWPPVTVASITVLAGIGLHAFAESQTFAIGAGPRPVVTFDLASTPDPLVAMRIARGE